MWVKKIIFKLFSKQFIAIDPYIGWCENQSLFVEYRVNEKGEILMKKIPFEDIYKKEK